MGNKQSLRSSSFDTFDSRSASKLRAAGLMRGFSGLMLIIIILLVALGGAVLVFEFFGKLAEKEDESEPALQEAAVQAEENLKSPSPKAEKVCYDQKVFWKWQTGGQYGQAQVYFSPDNKSSVGSLLDKDGKKTVYTFELEENGKVAFGIKDSDAHAYGTGSLTCDSITVTIKGACDTSCNLDTDNSDFLSKHRIDPSSLGFDGSVTIVNQ